MLWYIIDGWNVVHKIPKVRRAESPPWEFVGFLRRTRATGSRRNRVTIVFDGNFDPTEFSREKEFQVIFSMDRSADEVIKEKIRRYKNKKQIVVVSDDREIREFARLQGAALKRTQEFLAGKKKEPPRQDESRELPLSEQKKINEELRRIWLGE